MKRKSDKLRGGHYGNALKRVDGLEGSGGSKRVDVDENSRKVTDSSCSTQEDRYGVPLQVLSFSHMSPSERKDLARRLKFELEQLRMLRKTLSSSTDILTCSNVTNASQAAMSGNPNPSCNGREWSGNSRGRFNSAKLTSVPTDKNVMLMKQCQTLFTRLVEHRYGWVFREPVDRVKLNIPDYLTIIKHPMDLGTIQSKLNSGTYSSPLEFVADVRLTFRNAMEYNPKGHHVHTMADSLSKFFEQRWKTIEKKIPEVLPREELQIPDATPLKRRKVETVTESVRRAMKQNLAREVESMGEMPLHMVNFLRERSSNVRDAGEEEIEIDIDDLNDETLFTLRKLLDGYLLEKQIELLNGSGLSSCSVYSQ